MPLRRNNIAITLAALLGSSVAFFQAPAHQCTSQTARRPTSISVTMSEPTIKSDFFSSGMVGAMDEARTITIQGLQVTAGAYMAKVEVKNFKAVTSHKIIVGKKQLNKMEEEAGREVDIEMFFRYVIKFMLEKGMKLENTEGMIDAGVFPVNYFTVGQLHFFYEDSWDILTQFIRDDVKA